jgi:hypothetical protein
MCSTARFAIETSILANVARLFPDTQQRFRPLAPKILTACPIRLDSLDGLRYNPSLEASGAAAMRSQLVLIGRSIAGVTLGQQEAG